MVERIERQRPTRLSLQEYLKSAQYLPKELRGFDAQKLLFKRIDRIVAKRDWVNGVPDWMTAHIYVIDIFLWFMAMHGYTLQRSRLPLDRCPEFCELGQMLADFEAEQRELHAAELRKFIAERREGEGNANEQSSVSS